MKNFFLDKKYSVWCLLTSSYFKQAKVGADPEFFYGMRTALQKSLTSKKKGPFAPSHRLFQHGGAHTPPPPPDPCLVKGINQLQCLLHMDTMQVNCQFFYCQLVHSSHGLPSNAIPSSNVSSNNHLVQIPFGPIITSSNRQFIYDHFV